MDYTKRGTPQYLALGWVVVVAVIHGGNFVGNCHMAGVGYDSGVQVHRKALAENKAIFIPGVLVAAKNKIAQGVCYLLALIAFCFLYNMRVVANYKVCSAVYTVSGKALLIGTAFVGAFYAPVIVKDDYILAYQLVPSKSFVQFVRTLSSMTNLKVIYISFPIVYSLASIGRNGVITKPIIIIIKNIIRYIFLYK